MADEEFPCKYCEETFKTQTDWKAHVSDVHDVTGYPCDLCTEVFYKEHDYIQHFDAEHKSDFNRHVCSQCGVSYKWFKFLAQHIQKKHKIETMKQCERCGEEFYNSLAYRAHLKLKHVSGKKFHKCQKCHRSFTAKTFLQMHQKFDHSKKGPKLFKEYVLYNLNLSDQSLLDSTKKCLECDLQFSSSIYLFKHFKQTHNKKKYYQCCECNEAVYNTRAGLSIHLHYEHGIAREHKCAKCVTGHLTPPKTEQKRKEEPITKEVPSQSKRAPWSDKFKSNDLPNNLDLTEASEVEITNLRSNIRNLFQLLSTVPPSKLRASQKTDAKTHTFFTMKNFKSDGFSQDGRLRYEVKPRDENKIRNRAKGEAVKERSSFAAEASVNNVKQESRQNQTQFPCYKCKDKFTSRTALKLHLLKKHGFKGFPSNCHKSVREREILNRKCEENAVNEPKLSKDSEKNVTPKYKCNSCNYKFEEQELLLKHMTEEHGQGANIEENPENKEVFKCPDCYKAFDSETELSTHMNEHTKQDENVKKVCCKCNEHKKKTKSIYKCLKCDKKFKIRSVLRRHIKKQHRVPILKCQKCNATFKVAEKLAQHMKLKHSSLETALPVIKIQKSKLSPIKLDKLPNILSNILSRNLLNGTLHNCKICNSYFPSNELLQRHIQWEHTKNVNLHKCGQCNQVLYSVEDLELHMSTSHNSEGPKKWKKQIAFNYEHQTDL